MKLSKNGQMSLLTLTLRTHGFERKKELHGAYRGRPRYETIR